MATRTSLMEFQSPRIVHEEVDEQRGIFAIEPLDRGFGYTFGNSLRRVLLSSLEGAAVTSVKRRGRRPTSSRRCRSVREDVTDILLNLEASSAACGESPRSRFGSRKGSGQVTAADIQLPADLSPGRTPDRPPRRQGQARADDDRRPRPACLRS